MQTVSTILWDFDGVLLDSNATRDQGFVEVLNTYPTDQVEQLLAFHRRNGGLSRYVKFRHFFEVIRGESLSEQQLARLCHDFSEIMREKLVDPGLLIPQTNAYVRNHFQKYDMYIVSGSDQIELRYLCQQLRLTEFFKGIFGSPTPKIEWVANLMREHRYDPARTVLIGDSGNDFEAAMANGIHFIGYGDPAIVNRTTLHTGWFN